MCHLCEAELQKSEQGTPVVLASEVVPIVALINEAEELIKILRLTAFNQKDAKTLERCKTWQAKFDFFKPANPFENEHNG